MPAEFFQIDRISLTKDELYDYLLATYPEFFKGRDKMSIDRFEADQSDTSKVSIYFKEVPGV